MFSMLQYRTTFFQFFCVQFYRFCNASRFNHADIYVDTKTINKKARVSDIACGIGSKKNTPMQTKPFPEQLSLF